MNQSQSLKKIGSLLVFIWLVSVSLSPRVYAVIGNVETLAKAGVWLEFRFLESASILPYEPLVGYLVLHNGGQETLEYYDGLLTDTSVILKVFQADGQVVSVPFRNAREQVLWYRPPVINQFLL